MTIGGILFGIIAGVIVTLWLKKMFNDELLVIVTTVICASVTFFIAEEVFPLMGIRISGICSLVSLGLFMAAFGKTRIYPETEHSLNSVWGFLVWCSETFCFYLSGTAIGLKVLYEAHDFINEADYYKLFAIYLCLFIIRFGVFYAAWPILSNYGYGLT